MMEEKNNVPVISNASEEGQSRCVSDTIYFKVLIPSVAAGAIIGKNGEAIGQIQKETGAKIKLSKLNDFYPGTTERVGLIQGPLAGVRAMHNYIMDRIFEKPEISTPSVTPSGQTRLPQITENPNIVAPGYALWPLSVVCPGSTHPLFINRLLWERHKQVKILVPNCTAGLVIGKQGSYISEIKKTTGAFIQISQKSKDISLPERCITIAGKSNQLRAAVDMILMKIAEDPQSGTCPTISYSHTQGPVASAYPTGSPFAYTTPPPPPTSQSQTPLNSGHCNATAAIDHQKRDKCIPMTGAYYHNALQATYFAAAAAAAADYHQRLVGYHHQQHCGGEASGASSSIESAGGGFAGPVTPPSVEQDTTSIYTFPILPASQMVLQSSSATTPFAFLQPNTVTAGEVYSTSTGPESPVDSSGLPLLASSPPPPVSTCTMGTFDDNGSRDATATFFSPLHTPSSLFTSPTAAWLHARGFSEQAVAEITHAMSTLSAHGVLNIGTVTPPLEPVFLAPIPLPVSSNQIVQASPIEETEMEAGVSSMPDSPD